MNTDVQYWSRVVTFASIFRRKLFAFSIVVFMALMVGCGQGANEADVDQNGNGELIIGLTDAEGDFISYTVDVESITLTKANGTIVHVLPITTRVDFAQYTELTEFLTASMVPLGAYKHATMVLDYSDADIWVENSNGDAVQVIDIQDSAGDPVTELEMTVHLEGRNKLVISRGLPAHLTLDFDLNATNKAVFNDTGTPMLVVEPYLIADAYLQRPKAHRVRGPLNGVDVDNSQFEIIINPFHQRHTTDQKYGSLTVMTDDETVYDIDNQSYTGLPGLQAMDSLPQYTATIVIGKFKYNPTRFIAKEVYAGESVPGGTLDVVKGNVIARSENVLTIKGATLIRSGGTVTFNDEVTVNIAETTMVKKQLSANTHTIGEISVGQKVSVFGIITNSDVDNMVMDATNGVVRLKITKVYGASVDSTSNTMASNYFLMDAQRFNGRPVSLFDFSGTGVDVDNDADPSNYEVDTGMLPVDDIVEVIPIKVFGFVTPFGSAPADFTATTLVDLTKVPATLTMNWTPDTDYPFSEVTENSFTLNLMERGVFHHVGRGGAIVDLSTISPPPIIRGMANGGRYELKEKGPRRVFTDFASFVTEIEARLANGSSMKRIVAHGYFNDITATLTADEIHAKLK
jgi:Na+-transporting NADH:ubiquinone oxidoreductase subunit NqrC